MSLNIPVPITDLEQIGILSSDYLFVIEEQNQTKSVTWAFILSRITNLPDSLIFGYGSVELPSICFVDSNSGFYAPQLGSIAVSTDHTEKFAVRSNGLIELGDPLLKETSETTLLSPTTFKCNVRFLESIEVKKDITFHADLQINSNIELLDVIIKGELNGSDLIVFGDYVKFGSGDACINTFDCYSPAHSICGINAKKDVIVKKNLNNHLTQYNTRLITETLNVTQFTELNTVNTLASVIIDDGGRVELLEDGTITTTSDVTFDGVLTGDGQDITNLNLPTSLRLKGSIDPTTQGPGTPQHGDVWYSTTSGNFNNQWVGLEGQPVTTGRSFYYFATPLPKWVLGGISDLQSPYFMMIDLDQTATGNKQHDALIIAQNTVDTNTGDILASKYDLTGKATSALTVVTDDDSVITTKSYVDTRMTNATFDYNLGVSKYILGLYYNGSAPRTWNIDASPTGTDNLVKRNDQGDFSANVITAPFLDGVATDTISLDIYNANEENQYYEVPFTISPGDSKVIYRDSNFKYNPYTDALSVEHVDADITGDVTGNADTFTQFEFTGTVLSQFRTLWGQPFDATFDVVGDLINVGHVTPDVTDTRNIGADGNVFRDVYATDFHGTLSGSVTIGDSTRHPLINGAHILGSPWNGSTFVTWDIQCDDQTSPNQIVVRDGNANFSSNVITGTQFVGPLSGNVLGNATGTSSSVRGNTETTTRFEKITTLWTRPFNGMLNVDSDISEVNDILPSEAAEYSLGLEDKPFSNVYVDTISGNVDNNATSADQVNNALGRGDYIEGTESQWNGRLSDIWSVNPRSTNNPNHVVLRDINGSFTAGTITASFKGNVTGQGSGDAAGSSSSVTGNSVTASKFNQETFLWLQSFDGTSDIRGDIKQTGNIIPELDNTYTIGDSGVIYKDVYADTFHGYFQDNVTSVDKLTNTLSTGSYIGSDPWNGSENVTWNLFARSDNEPSSVVNRDNVGSFDANEITSDLVGSLTGDVTGNVSEASGSVTGNSATATAFETLRLISISVTGTLVGQTTFQYIQRQGEPEPFYDAFAQLETEVGDITISDLQPLPE